MNYDLLNQDQENEIKIVYERFKHLDLVLSDPVMMNEDDNPIHKTCYELWKAIKKHLGGGRLDSKTIDS